MNDGGAMYPESDLLPLSALQHLVFCERQCALIHLEQAWAENLLTAEGRVLHEKVHDQGHETRRGMRIVRSLPVRSLRLGVSGVADVVEFGPQGVRPVEYKRGRPKKDLCDVVQLCAQAMCLEEMLGCSVLEGDLFYGAQRRRKEVAFDERIRRETEAAARRLHALVDSGTTPPPRKGPWCKSCSLVEECMPQSAGGRARVTAYIRRMTGDDE